MRADETNRSATSRLRHRARDHSGAAEGSKNTADHQADLAEETHAQNQDARHRQQQPENRE